MTGTEADRVKQCLMRLSRTDRYAVLMFFADELTPMEIGLVLDVSLQRVQDILDRFRANVVLTLRPETIEADTPPVIEQWLGSLGSATS
jgi:DNA-directed RNA polymerase specialized sigma24 family protein